MVKKIVVAMLIGLVGMGVTILFPHISKPLVAGIGMGFYALIFKMV